MVCNIHVAARTDGVDFEEGGSVKELAAAGDSFHRQSLSS